MIIKGLAFPLKSRIEGVVGESVVLLCCYNGIKGNSVHWRDDKGMKVCDINNGTAIVGPEYQGRVECFPNEYKNGNCSIKLKYLQSSDAGEYSCLITGSSQHFETYKLSIREKPEESEPTEPKLTSLAAEFHDVPNVIWTVFFCVLLLFYMWEMNECVLLFG
ncbi:polymeric immunoglobulin receptor-like [Misgurnus anguillicaudatus]|uniref:polymeric immunoglobulin receptor-like n=1 Tax=Misgurnus anguillicaudatus TaxID=75329 RepID=UPI003CCF492F